MTDITMCQPTNCDKKTTCYRYTATPSERQAYNDFSAINKAQECEFYKCDMHFLPSTEDIRKNMKDQTMTDEEKLKELKTQAEEDIMIIHCYVDGDIKELTDDN